MGRGTDKPSVVKTTAGQEVVFNSCIVIICCFHGISQFPRPKIKIQGQVRRSNRSRYA